MEMFSKKELFTMLFVLSHEGVKSEFHNVLDVV